MLRPKSIFDLEIESHWVYCSIIGNPMMYSTGCSNEIVIEEEPLHRHRERVRVKAVRFRHLQNVYWGTKTQIRMSYEVEELLTRLIKYPTHELKITNRIISIVRTLRLLSSMEFNSEVLPLLC